MPTLPVAVVALILSLTPLFASAAAALTVVASIKPVHSLASSVIGTAGQPVLLMPGGASPHTYTLKPSDAQALGDADVIFWIGPGLETMLERPLATLATKADVVALATTPGVTLLPVRDGGAWESHDHGDDHRHDHRHGGGHGNGQDSADMHLWLDPRNAIAIVDRMAAALAKAAPASAAQFAANAERTKEELKALDLYLDQATLPLRDKPYIVFHDAYQYFEARYQLAAVGSVTVSPERQPGARHLAGIRAKIERLGATCVFTEPQFPPALVKTVVDGTRARTGTLDPIGADLQPGPEAYPLLLKRLASNLHACLVPGA